MTNAAAMNAITILPLLFASLIGMGGFANCHWPALPTPDRQAPSRVAAADAPAPLGQAPLDHPFHVSKCLIHYRPAKQSLQMSLHIFLDDLELALAQRGHDKLFLCTDKEAEQAESYLISYLRETFQLKLNGADRAFSFEGKEISDDLAAVWCYLEVKPLTQLKSLELRYSLLMDTYDDQKNLANIDLPGQDTGTLLFSKGRELRRVDF
jgi:hypothetical protein